MHSKLQKCIQSHLLEALRLTTDTTTKLLHFIFICHKFFIRPFNYHPEGWELQLSGMGRKLLLIVLRHSSWLCLGGLPSNILQPTEKEAARVSVAFVHPSAVVLVVSNDGAERSN